MPAISAITGPMLRLIFIPSYLQLVTLGRW
jgi:hypothetical protein